VYYWDPSTKEESMQRVHKGSPSSKKAKTQNSRGKLMATVFLDMEGILLTEYMKKCFTKEVYKETIRKLKTAI
jgi:hypothetical protein